MKEREIIERLRAAFPENGIGDDTAVLPAAEGEVLFASDAVVENVHFSRRYSTLAQAVSKAVTSNVSDIYAMGGEPRSIALSMGIPAGCGEAEIDSIVEGLAAACGAYGVTLAGGDTVRSPAGFFFDVAIVGSLARRGAVRRSGAKEGDALVLFGEIGPSLAGMSLLGAFLGPCGGGGSGVRAPRFGDCAAAGARLRTVAPRLSLATDAAARREMAAGLAHIPHAAEILRFMQRHLAPRTEPIGGPLANGESLAAMIDVSDGLAKDLGALCAESRAGALVDASALPIPHSIADIFDLDGDSLADFAHASGEEYVLLAAVRPGALGDLPSGASVIGRIAPEREGIVLCGAGGRRAMPALGYEHEF